MTCVDLHLHLLPGVDDGARDEPSALAHAARMVADGVTAATVTPHVGAPCFAVDPREIAERTAVLQRALHREGIGLRLRPGGEVHPEGLLTLTGAELEAVAQGPPGARWILSEVPFAGVDDDFAAALRTVRRRGLGLVIAHPERAAGLLEDGGLTRLRPLIEDGAVLQVNACSLLGHHGEEAGRAAARLVRAGLAYVIASDGHPGSREHTLADGAAAAARSGASRTQILQLTEANPRFLLQHGLPCPAPRRAVAIARARDAARRLRPRELRSS